MVFKKEKETIIVPYKSQVKEHYNYSFYRFYDTNNRLSGAKKRQQTNFRQS